MIFLAPLGQNTWRPELYKSLLSTCERFILELHLLFSATLAALATKRLEIQMSDTNTPSNENPAAAPVASDRPDGGRKCGHRGHRRRGLFLLIPALVFGLIGFGVGRATGGHWPGHGFAMHQQLDGDQAVRMAQAGAGHILVNVDATTEQKAKIDDIVKAAMKDLLPMRETFMGARDKIATVLKAATVDRAALEQIRADQSGLGDKASKRAVLALADAAGVLTPAQRAMLVERWQNPSWWD